MWGWGNIGTFYMLTRNVTNNMNHRIPDKQERLHQAPRPELDSVQLCTNIAVQGHQKECR